MLDKRITYCVATLAAIVQTSQLQHTNPELWEYAVQSLDGLLHMASEDMDKELHAMETAMLRAACARTPVEN